MDKLQEMTTLLLDHGAHMRIGGPQDDNRTALQEAIRHRYWSLAELFLDRADDVNAIYDGDLVLEMAVYYGAKLKMVKRLVEHGAKIRGSLALGKKACRISNDGEKLDMGVLRFLVDNGPPPETQQGTYTAVHAAAEHGNKILIEFLLDEGFSAVARDADGNTPLHAAVWETWGKSPVVQPLIDRGADINAVNDAGDTPLHVAVGKRGDHRGYNEPMAEVLIERGAKVNIQNKLEETPLHRAAANCRVPKACYGWPIGLDNARKIFRMLLDHGASVAVADGNGKTALHHLLDRLNGSRDL